MSSSNAEASKFPHTVLDPAAHELHQCRTAEEFRTRLEALTGRSVEHIADEVVRGDAPKAIFVVGSIPLGMGTRGSDVDLFVLIDGRDAFLNGGERIANSDQQASFFKDDDALLAGEFLTLHTGILVDLQVVITPAIRSVYQRLRRRGPELSEAEIRTLGRLSTGWLLWQSEDYIAHHSVSLSDPALMVYCCTKYLVTALTDRRKAGHALEIEDLPLALQMGRASVEMAHLAYFASEGLPYLGGKWLAQIGSARGSQERVARHPLLRHGTQLLFPALGWNAEEAARYLQSVSEFLTSMQSLIERQALFRIAFKACAQIASA